MIIPIEIPTAYSLKNNAVGIYAHKGETLFSGVIQLLLGASHCAFE